MKLWICNSFIRIPLLSISILIIFRILIIYFSHSSTSISSILPSHTTLRCNWLFSIIIPTFLPLLTITASLHSVKPSFDFIWKEKEKHAGCFIVSDVLLLMVFMIITSYLPMVSDISFSSASDPFSSHFFLPVAPVSLLPESKL